MDRPHAKLLAVVGAMHGGSLTQQAIARVGRATTEVELPMLELLESCRAFRAWRLLLRG